MKLFRLPSHLISPRTLPRYHSVSVLRHQRPQVSRSKVEENSSACRIIKGHRLHLGSSTINKTAKMSQDAAKKTKVPFIVQYFDPSTRAKDPSGRGLDDVLAYSDSQISRKHDFIQYLFPLPEESMVNPWAPLITKDTYIAFRDSEALRKELLQGLLRMLEFYGFTYSTSTHEEGGSEQRKIVPGPNFSEQSKHAWRRSMDHNHLRLTRIIRCLRVLSCEAEAKALYQALLENDTSNVVSRSSKMFWGRAANRPLWLPPDEPDDDAKGIKWLRQVSEAKDENEPPKEAGKESEVLKEAETGGAGVVDGGANKASTETEEKGKLS